MKLRLNVVLAWCAIWLCVGAASVNCAAQGPEQGNWMPPNAEMFECEGTVAAAAPTGLQVLAKENNAAWLVQITRQSDVSITGTAEPSFLRPGLSVRFSGEVDDKGKLQQDLTALEIFTPSGKYGVGIFESGADENTRPISKLAAGTYDIRGKVLSLKDGQLTVQAGKKIVGTLAADAKITVNVRDLTYAQPESEVKVKGFYFANMAANPAIQRPGQAMAKEVHVTLTKPLVGKVKAAPSRPSRGNKQQPEETPAVDVADPFGLEKK